MSVDESRPRVVAVLVHGPKEYRELCRVYDWAQPYDVRLG